MRVKRGVTAHQKHKKLRQQTQGMSHMRRASVRMAKQAIIKALSNAYRDRRNRKRDLRSLWITRISAATTEQGLSYSRFMGMAKTAGLELDRKTLAELAARQPTAFQAVIDHVKAAK
jgi:large subunit ribosomal protein L20